MCTVNGYVTGAGLCMGGDASRPVAGDVMMLLARRRFLSHDQRLALRFHSDRVNKKITKKRKPTCPEATS